MRSVEPDRDVLEIEKLVDAPVSAFAPDARHLHAAERRLRGRGDSVVHPDDAELERLGYSIGAAEILGPEISRESEWRGIRETDRFVIGLEREYRCNRAERLFVHQLHLGLDPGEHGGLIVEPGERLAAGEHGSAALPRIG